MQNSEKREQHPNSIRRKHECLEAQQNKARQCGGKRTGLVFALNYIVYILAVFKGKSGEFETDHTVNEFICMQR